MTSITASHVDHAAENRNRVLGVVFAAAGAGLFSLKGVVIKLAYAEHMGVSQLLTLRMLFSLPFYLAVGIWAYRRAPMKPTLKMYAIAAVLGILSYYISSALNFEGLKYVSAQLERLILYCYPTMVAVLAWAFLGEKITGRHVIALVLAYAGIAVLFGAEIGHQGGQVWLGGGLILAGAVLYAIYVTASRSVIRGMGSWLFTSFAMTAASVCFLAQSGVEMISTPWPPVSANGMWLCAILAVVCTVIPSFLIADAIGRIGPGPMSAIGGVGPVVAAWAAVGILHEPFGWPHLVAMGLTMFGVWLLARSPRPRIGIAAAKAASPTP
jgi:drug/metabolite transporter (DMT)-like permease